MSRWRLEPREHLSLPKLLARPELPERLEPWEHLGPAREEPVEAKEKPAEEKPASEEPEHLELPERLKPWKHPDLLEQHLIWSR